MSTSHTRDIASYYLHKVRLESMSSTKRLAKEILEIEEYAKQDPDNVVYSVSPSGMAPPKIFEWSGFLFGPKDSPYEGGAFKIAISYPQSYPFKPPNVVFKTLIYHPNIGQSGHICLDILKDKWSPALTTHKLLLSISSLLTQPNPDDPLDRDAADVYKRDQGEFAAIARRMTAQHAQF